jgi:hypothetical protein
MANRFLDTNYYKSPFVRSLPGKLKSLYSFIICDCDGAGIWNMDMQAASMYIGFEVTQREFEENFTARGKAINLGGSKFFFPDFIEHQYPSGLQTSNKAHKNFINILTKYGLLDSNQQILKKEAPLEDALKASQVKSLSSNGNGLGHVNGGVGEIVYYNAEEEISKNQIEFERICIATGKNRDTAENSLRMYHLHLEEKSQYPKSKKSLFAGFEKWLRNEKNFLNGTHQRTSATNSTRTTKSSGAEKLAATLREELGGSYETGE